MKTTGSMMKNIVRLNLAIVCAVIFGLPQAMASPANQGQENAHRAVWGKWQPLAEGFIARRRVPEGVELDKTLRRASTTQVHELRLPGAAGLDRLKPGGSSSVWIYTGSEGLYKVSLADFSTATGIELQKLRDAASKGFLSFSNAGNAVSWYFDASKDRLLFTGEKYETFYTKGNAYRVQQTTKSDPQRMKEIPKSKARVPTGLQTPFREVLQFEKEGDMMVALWLYPSDPDARYWFWDYLHGGYKSSLNIGLHVPNPVHHGTGRIQIRLHGITDYYPGNDHQVYAQLNGFTVGSVLSWDGLNPAVLTADFDQGLLSADGNNTLTLNSVQGGQLLESISVAYDRLPKAENGQLWIRNVSGGSQEVGGFTGSDILVIQSPVRNSIVRRDVNVYRGTDGKWAVSFAAKQGSDYLIAQTSALQKPALDGRLQANLTAGGNAADYLVIAPRDFSGTAQALADYRKNHYGAVKVVWLDDIYKSFGAGRRDPFAIGRFMDYVRWEWSKAPSVVTLVGKGSLDRKDSMGYGDNFLPVLMTANPWALCESDSRLLGVDEGAAPFAIGRLPITNDTEGMNYVDKLIAHEAQIGGQDAYRAVVVADNPDGGGDFHADADGLVAELQRVGFSPILKLYHPASRVRDTLTLSSTWTSYGFISYSGHGSMTQLGDFRENFLTCNDAAVLKNAMYPVFSALTCASGSDAFPGTRSLAGSLVLNPEGGAIAALAPTGLSSNRDAHVLGRAFIENLYGGYDSVGEALVEAKRRTVGQIGDFMVPMYSIVGDPDVNPR